ncbi:MAG: precorrin-6A synthase (deacetylating) [Acidimicrobiales bacterium]
MTALPIIETPSPAAQWTKPGCCRSEAVSWLDALTGIRRRCTRPGGNPTPAPPPIRGALVDLRVARYGVRVTSASVDRPGRQVVVVGIGAGDPQLVTLEALAALAGVDVIVGFDKGERAAELHAVREAVLDSARDGRPCRVVQIADGRRDEAKGYEQAVGAWHGGRADALERVLLEEVADDEVVGLLVWGDPSLYDSTLRVLDQVAAHGRVDVHVRVVPGVSSLHVLTARFAIALHAVGGSVLITTGRRLRQGIPDGIDDVAVFLDAECSFTAMTDGGWHIYWGAFLGMPDERLVSGSVDEVADDLVRIREDLRQRHGWLFDCYLLRRR